MANNSKKDVDTSIPKQTAIVSNTVDAPVKSRRKVSFKEFVLDKNLRREAVAGFKMYVEGVEFMTSEDWNAAYNKYITRKI